MKHILVVDNEPNIGMIFTKILSEQGYPVKHMESAEEAFPLIQSKNSPEIVFLDIRLPGMDGIAALSKFKEANSSLRIIMMTAYQTVESVVTAMKSGAMDYLVKPLDPQMILQAVKKYSTSIDNRTPTAEELGFVAHTPMMKSVLNLAEKFAQDNGTILVLGESGTGKERLAHFIHQKSKRSKKSLIVVDCASIPDSLFESELFGYEKGAFTGADTMKEGRLELANEGTLFLDEIGNIPLAIQAKLLRFIENKQISRLGGKKMLSIDCRLIAATNADLEDLMKKGLFREDLFYRISGLTITLPPLRNRPIEERKFLLEHLLKENSRRVGRPKPTVSNAAHQIIMEYPWPGNVREFQNAIHSATITCESNVIDTCHLPVGIQSYFTHKNQNIAANQSEGQTLKEILRRVEREQILVALKKTKGNKKKASELLDMDYKSFLSKLKEYSKEREADS